MAPVVGCSPISPTLGLLCLMTPRAKGVVSVSPSVSRQPGGPIVQSVWFSYSQAPYVPCSFNPNLEMVSDKNTRRCILTREHVLAFYWFSEKIFFWIRAISRQCLFMVTILTMGLFLLQPWYKPQLHHQLLFQSRAARLVPQCNKMCKICDMRKHLHPFIRSIMN